MSIQFKIFAGFIFVVAVSFSSFLYWLVADIRPQFRKATEESLVDESRMLASVAGATARGGHVDAGLFEKTMNDAYDRKFYANIYGFVKSEVDTRVYITDEKGIVVFDSTGMDIGKDYSLWNDVKLTLVGRYGARSTRSILNDPATSTMYVAAPVMDGDRIIGVLSVGKPAMSINKFVEESKRKMTRGGLVVVFVAMLVGIVISWRVTAPIYRLTDYARAVRDGRKTTLPRLGGVETRELGAAFEEMRAGLDGKEYVENYIQTLTHEIKSPLSAIRGAAELLDEDMPPEQRRRFIENIRAESARIGGVVEKLLLLSSLEKQNNVTELRLLNMKEILAEVKESLYPVLTAKRVTLEITTSGDCGFDGDPFLIRQAVANIIQNALDFSCEGGVVTADCVREDMTIVLRVTDRGCGVPDYANERIFERFYSLKRPDTGKKSTGLGLCLVREVALLHKGDVMLSSAPGGGTVARFCVPVR